MELTFFNKKVLKRPFFISLFCYNIKTLTRNKLTIMKKYVVFTGEYAELGVETDEFKDAELSCTFPEHFGIQRAVKAVQLALTNSNVSANGTTVIVTRSSEVVNFFGLMVDSGVLKKEQVEIKLFRENANPETHTFDDEGMIDGSWPYGCLMMWFDDTLHEMERSVKNGD